MESLASLMNSKTPETPAVAAAAAAVSTAPVNAMDAFSNTCHTMQHQILSRVFYGCEYSFPVFLGAIAFV